MIKKKISLRTIGFWSLIVQFFLVIPFLPWGKQIYESILKNTPIYLIIVLLSFYTIIFIIFYIFLSRVTYRFRDGVIEKGFSFFGYKHRSYRYFDKKKTVFIKKENFFSDLFGEERIILYGENRNKILAITIKKQDGEALYHLLIDRKETHKLPYIKGRDFVYSFNNVISVFLDRFILILVSYLPIVSSFLFIKVERGNLFGNIYDIWIYSLLFLLLLFALSVIFSLIHMLESKLRIEDLYLSFETGKFFRKTAFVPLQILGNVSLRTGFFAKKSHFYKMIIKFEKMDLLIVPVNRDNLKALIGDEINLTFETKKVFNYKYFIIISIFNALIGTLLVFFDIFFGVLLFAYFELFFVLRISLTNYLIKNEKTIIKKGIIRSTIHISYVKTIKKASIESMPFSTKKCIFYYDNNKVYFLLPNSEIDNLKENLGYKKTI